MSVAVSNPIPVNPVEKYLRMERIPHIWCPGCGIGTALNAFIPVSYTHLRAHETVLDIVCRLLLETTN